MFRFEQGDDVIKLLPSGACFEGRILAGYRRLNGKIEYICETEEQVLFIIQEGNLVERRKAPRIVPALK